MSTKITITNDINKQIEIGRILFADNTNVYSDSMVKTIKDVIDRCYPNFKRKDLSKEDLFFISIYDYWTVGCTVNEGLYYHFIDKTIDEKRAFITLRDRLQYTNLLNNKDDSHMLTFKYEAYEILKPLYKREVIRICDEGDYDTFVDFISRHPQFVAKPEGASMSIGVHLVDSANYKKNIDLFNQLLDEGKECIKHCSWCAGTSVVLEEIIQQSEIMASLHPASINNLRCISILHNDEVSIFFPCVKIGMNHEFICSGASGSLIAAVDPETGIVVTNARTEVLTEYSVHPDTGMKIKGFQIPEWEQMKEVVSEAARQFPSIPFVGWDVVHSSKGWVIMEGNYATEFVCCQLPYQEGFRDRFEKVIGFSLNRDKFWWE